MMSQTASVYVTLYPHGLGDVLFKTICTINILRHVFILFCDDSSFLLAVVFFPKSVDEKQHRLDCLRVSVCEAANAAAHCFPEIYSRRLPLWDVALVIFFVSILSLTEAHQLLLT